MKQSLAWHVGPDAKPARLQAGSVDLEKHLEDWLVDDIDIVADDVLVISRQPVTTWGSKLDLLAIDAQGNLVVIELKRNQTLRDTVAQAIEYAAWVAGLTYEEIRELAKTYFGSDDQLDLRFQQRFAADLPETLNLGQRLMVVAPQIDSVTETVINYLAGKLQVPINAVGFDVFGGPGDQTLVRHFVREPANVPPPKPSGNKPSRTLDELKAAATANGVGELVDTFLSLTDLLPSIIPYYLTFNLRAKTPDKRVLSGVSVYPTAETSANAVELYVGYDNLKSLFGLSDDEIERLRLELRGHAAAVLRYNWTCWDRLEVKTTAQAQAVCDSLRAAITAAHAQP
ncbi:MAG: endonuclease NucS domain-containing protein [Tepidiformaceae bacterium]